MAQYNTDDFRPFNEYYYIVNMVNFMRPEVFPVYFLNKRAAQRALKKTSKYGELQKYEILKGKKIASLKLKYLLLLGNMPKHTKYEYPKDCITERQKRSFRKNMQRRLLRMKLFTHIKSKGRIGESAQVIKLVRKPNTENMLRRFYCPDTQARVIRLERKPRKYWYYIISTKDTEKKRVLKIAKALKFNGTTGDYKEVYLQIYKKDIIIPYLVKDWVEMLKHNKHGEDCLRYFRESYPEWDKIG